MNKFFVIIFSLVVLSGCNGNTQTSRQTTQPIDDKFYCETGGDCVDGEYCEVTNRGGCVNSDWWWKNVGNKYDCMPDPNICACEDKRCVKK